MLEILDTFGVALGGGQLDLRQGHAGEMVAGAVVDRGGKR